MDRKPFSLVYPKDVIDNPTGDTCTTTREVRVFFDVIGRSVMKVVENEGVFSETKAWFLLN